MAQKTSGSNAGGDTVFTPEEASAIGELVSYALEADMVRPPYEAATQSALAKLGMAAEGVTRGAALKAAATRRLPPLMH